MLWAFLCYEEVVSNKTCSIHAREFSWEVKPGMTVVGGKRGMGKRNEELNWRGSPPSQLQRYKVGGPSGAAQVPGPCMVEGFPKGLCWQESERESLWGCTDPAGLCLCNPIPA